MCVGERGFEASQVSQKVEAIAQQGVGCDTLRNSESVTEVSRGPTSLAACTAGELDFGGPGAVGRAGTEEAGERLGEVGELVSEPRMNTDGR